MTSRRERDGSYPSRSHQHILFAILALSMLVRLVVALYLGNEIDSPPLLTDQRSYHALGQRLLQGKGYSFDRDWYPFTQADEPTAHWSFLYSALVAGIYALAGPNPLAVRIIQGLLGGALLPLVVHNLARRCMPCRPTVWLWSSLLAACYGYYVLYAATVMTETAFIILLVVSMDLSMHVRDDVQHDTVPEWRVAIRLGFALGLTTLIRQSILPWLPVLFLWLLFEAKGEQRRAVFGRLFVSGLLVVLLILPWTVRNYYVYGEFLLLNSNAGYAMYSAQHPMHGTVFREFDAAPVPAKLWAENEAVKDKIFMGIGLNWVIQEPWRYLRLCLSRVRAFFEFWPSRDTVFLNNIGRVGSYGLYLPMYLMGWAIVWRDRALRYRMVLPAVFGGFYAIIHIATWAMVRYRLPVDAVLMPVAALSAERIGRWAWQRARLDDRFSTDK